MHSSKHLPNYLLASAFKDYFIPYHQARSLAWKCTFMPLKTFMDGWHRAWSGGECWEGSVLLRCNSKASWFFMRKRQTYRQGCLGSFQNGIIHPTEQYFNPNTLKWSLHRRRLKSCRRILENTTSRVCRLDRWNTRRQCEEKSQQGGF